MLRFTLRRAVCATLVALFVAVPVGAQFEELFAQMGGGGGGGGLEQMFGGGGMRRGKPRTRDSLSKLNVRLEEFYNGGFRIAKLRRNILCKSCKGTGAAGGKRKRCKTCSGQGVRMVNQQMGPGFQVQMQQQCDRCGGTGHIAAKKCKVCSGNKVVSDEGELRVEIKKGMVDGEEIRFEAMSEEAPDHDTGDMVFKLEMQPHPYFTRVNTNDLEMTIEISLEEALLGFTRDVTHLDGHTVVVSSDAVTIPHEVKVVNGEGMPLKDGRGDGDNGDLYVKMFVVFPDTLTQPQMDEVARLLSPDMMAAAQKEGPPPAAARGGKKKGGKKGGKKVKKKGRK